MRDLSISVFSLTLDLVPTSTAIFRKLYWLNVLHKPYLTISDKTICSWPGANPSTNTMFVITLLCWARSVRRTDDKKGDCSCHVCSWNTQIFSGSAKDTSLKKAMHHLECLGSTRRFEECHSRNFSIKHETWAF